MCDDIWHIFSWCVPYIFVIYGTHRHHSISTCASYPAGTRRPHILCRSSIQDWIGPFVATFLSRAAPFKACSVFSLGPRYQKSSMTERTALSVISHWSSLYTCLIIPLPYSCNPWHIFPKIMTGVSVTWYGSFARVLGILVVPQPSKLEKSVRFR